MKTFTIFVILAAAIVFSAEAQIESDTNQSSDDEVDCPDLTESETIPDDSISTESSDDDPIPTESSDDDDATTETPVHGCTETAPHVGYCW